MGKNHILAFHSLNLVRRDKSTAAVLMCLLFSGAGALYHPQQIQAAQLASTITAIGAVSEPHANARAFGTTRLSEPTGQALKLVNVDNPYNTQTTTGDAIPAVITPGGTTADSPADLFVVSPFLLGVADGALGNLNLRVLLPKIQDWSAVTAKALAADNTSAAIVIFRTNSPENVKFTTNDGTSLLPYANNFLIMTPKEGTDDLIVPSSQLVKVGSIFYAAALVQAPGLGAKRSFATAITVTARQGAETRKTSMALVPPPVVLVHGLWGNDKSLEFVEDTLTNSAPWNNHPELVQAIQYTNDISFDASEPASALGNEIRNLLQTGARSLDAQQIVGGRVDIVAHSMGGLVLRHYATLMPYRSPRDREQGQFHQIVTLDTPESGSQLATYLFDHRGCTLQTTSSFTSALLWAATCQPPTLTVEACFATAKAGMPLGPSNHLRDGAVFALEPDSPSFRRLTTGPDIEGAIWRAVTAVALSDSLLKFELDGLIDASANLSHATIPNCPSSPSTPTVNSILDGANDGIVRLTSQLRGARTGQFTTFRGLAHAPANPAGFTLDRQGSNSNVEHSSEVATLAACWLSNDGAATCNPKGGILTAATSNATPQFDVNQLHSVSRLTIHPPSAVQLGTPFDLTIDVSSSQLRRLVLNEGDELGHHAAWELPLPNMAGRTIHADITPMLFGSVTFTLDALFEDGGVETDDVAVPVQPPAAAPEVFLGDAASPKLGIVFDPKEGMNAYVLHPKAIYASTPDRIDAYGIAHPNPVNLDARVVHYSIVQRAGEPVVTLQTNAYGYDPSTVSIVALHAGTATIEARFGSAIDYLQVFVGP
jgi:pimeloyl-ACP methyl ester carboxylesterase